MAGEIKVNYNDEEEEGLSETNESDSPLTKEEQEALQK